jgi:hypothetical protein
VSKQGQIEQHTQDWQGPAYAYLRPKPLLPDPDALRAARVIYANPKLAARFNRAANLDDPQAALRALSYVISQASPVRVAVHQRRTAPRGRERRSRSVARASSRGGDSGDPEPADDSDGEPPAGGVIVGARRRSP